MLNEGIYKDIEIYLDSEGFFMYVLALNGSHNTDGNTAYLLNLILDYCKKMGAKTECENVYEAITDAKFPFCVSCSSPCNGSCYKGTKLEEVFNKVTKADFVLIGSPVYFGSMTGELKCFFDKARDIRAKKAWLNKKMAAVSVGASKYGGQEHTAEHIIACSQVLGMTVLANSSESCMGHFGVLGQKPPNEDEYAKAQAKIMAERIMMDK